MNWKWKRKLNIFLFTSFLFHNSLNRFFFFLISVPPFPFIMDIWHTQSQQVDANWNWTHMQSPLQSQLTIVQIIGLYYELVFRSIPPPPHNSRNSRPAPAVPLHPHHIHTSVNRYELMNLLKPVNWPRRPLENGECSNARMTEGWPSGW